MRLQPGQQAPDFSAETWDGHTVSLAAHKNQRIWLAFFRYASCPLCNLRVRDIVLQFDEFQRAGLAILCVFQSTKENMAQYVAQQKPPFPLIADPNEQLYQLYQLESSTLGFIHPANVGRLIKSFSAGFSAGKMEGTYTRIPADFLINSDGTLHDCYYGAVIADHIPFETVRKFAGL